MDMAHVADGICVIEEIHQRDMCEDMPVVTSRVVGEGVDDFFDAQRVPHSVWELHSRGHRDRGVMPDRNGRPVKVPASGGRVPAVARRIRLGARRATVGGGWLTRERGGGFGSGRGG